MLTSLIFLLAKNCNAVLALLKKCGLRKTLPLSIGCKSNVQMKIKKKEKNLVAYENKFLPIFHQTTLPIAPKVLCHPEDHRLSHRSEAVELAVAIRNQNQ